LFFILLLQLWQKEPDFSEWKVSYRYVLFFKSTKGLKPGCLEIEDAIRHTTKSVILEVETIIGNKPILFKAFQESNEVCEIQFEDLP